MADTTRTTSGSFSGGTAASVPSGGQRQGDDRIERGGQDSKSLIEQGAGRAIEDAKQIGTELFAAVRDSATTLFEEQRNRAANEITALSHTLRNSVQSLDQKSGMKGGTVAHYGDEAARQIGDFAERLRDRSWSELTGDIENFGRRWPIAFVAGAIGIGFVAGRFMISSAARSGAADTPSSSQARPIGHGGDTRGAARIGGAGVSGAMPGNSKPGSGVGSPPENR